MSVPSSSHLLDAAARIARDLVHVGTSESTPGEAIDAADAIYTAWMRTVDGLDIADRILLLRDMAGWSTTHLAPETTDRTRVATATATATAVATATAERYVDTVRGAVARLARALVERGDREGTLKDLASKDRLRILFRDALTTQVPRLLPGAAIPGSDFRLVELLGQGAFGEAWLIADPDRPNTPAVGKFCMDPEHAAVVRHEKRLLGQLSHPNIVKLIGAYTHPPEGFPPWLHLEYVDGGTLHDWFLGHARPPAWRDVLTLIRQILSGVSAAHALGIVHRDLKPANILLTRDRVPKVTDFGIGKDLSRADASREQTLTMRGWGSKRYASDQQMEGLPAVPADDVFSLGRILGEMLVGVTDRDPVAVVAQLERMEQRSDLPKGLRAMTLRWSAEKRADRPADARTALAELDAWERSLAGAAAEAERARVAIEAESRRREERSRQQLADAEERGRLSLLQDMGEAVGAAHERGVIEGREEMLRSIASSRGRGDSTSDLVALFTDITVAQPGSSPSQSRLDLSLPSGFFQVARRGILGANGAVLGLLSRQFWPLAATCTVLVALFGGTAAGIVIELGPSSLWTWALAPMAVFLILLFTAACAFASIYDQSVQMRGKPAPVPRLFGAMARGIPASLVVTAMTLVVFVSVIFGLRPDIREDLMARANLTPEQREQVARVREDALTMRDRPLGIPRIATAIGEFSVVPFVVLMLLIAAPGTAAVEGVWVGKAVWRAALRSVRHVLPIVLAFIPWALSVGIWGLAVANVAPAGPPVLTWETALPMIPYFAAAVVLLAWGCLITGEIAAAMVVKNAFAERMTEPVTAA